VKCNDGNQACFTGKILVLLKSEITCSFQQRNDFILKTNPKKHQGKVPPSTTASSGRPGLHRCGQTHRSPGRASGPPGRKQKHWGFTELRSISTVVRGFAAAHSEQMQNLHTVSSGFIARIYYL